MPESVNVPAPVLASAPVAPLMMPLTVVDVLSPVVRVWPALIWTAPAPASEPMVSELTTCSAPPPSTTTAPVSAIAAPLSSRNVPPFTRVSPV